MLAHLWQGAVRIRYGKRDLQTYNGTATTQRQRGHTMLQISAFDRHAVLRRCIAKLLHHQLSLVLSLSLKIMCVPVSMPTVQRRRVCRQRWCERQPVWRAATTAARRPAADRRCCGAVQCPTLLNALSLRAIVANVDRPTTTPTRTNMMMRRRRNVTDAVCQHTCNTSSS